MDNKRIVKNSPSKQTKRGKLNKKRLAALVAATSIALGASIKVGTGILSNIQSEINNAKNSKDAMVSILNVENELSTIKYNEFYSNLEKKMYTDNYVSLINYIGTEDSKLQELLPRI